MCEFGIKDPDDNKVELWGTVSIDGGSSWAPNFKISQGQTSCLAATIGGDGNECGDYIAMDFYDGKLVTSWTDSSNFTGDNPNGTSGLDVYFSKVTVTVPIPEPATYGLMAMGLLFGAARLRRKG